MSLPSFRLERRVELRKHVRRCRSSFERAVPRCIPGTFASRDSCHCLTRQPSQVPQRGEVGRDASAHRLLPEQRTEDEFRPRNSLSCRRWGNALGALDRKAAVVFYWTSTARILTRDRTRCVRMDRNRTAGLASLPRRESEINSCRSTRTGPFNISFRLSCRCKYCTFVNHRPQNRIRYHKDVIWAFRLPLFR